MSAPREMFDGKFRYPAIVVGSDRQQLSPTVFVDWFETDEAAEVGFREIMEWQGFDVRAVRVGEVTEVEIA